MDEANAANDVVEKGFNAGLIVLLLENPRGGWILLVFLVGNHVLYMYAQKAIPARKKKPVSKNKMKSEKTEARCFPAPGE